MSNADRFADALAKHWVPYMRAEMFRSNAIFGLISERAWNRRLFVKTRRGFKVLVKQRPKFSGGSDIVVPLTWR